MTDRPIEVRAGNRTLDTFDDIDDAVAFVEELRGSDDEPEGMLHAHDPNKDDAPCCSIDGCDESSDFLLPPEGDLCLEHAKQRHPDTVAYLNWAHACNQDAVDEEAVKR